MHFLQDAFLGISLFFRFHNPFDIESDTYGVKYRYRIPITGPNGKTLNVIAVYWIDQGKTDPRMVTNYIDNQKKQKKHRKEKSR